MTVTWHPAALEELVRLFLIVKDKREFRAAVDEVDSLLRVKPEHKGQSWFAGQLDSETLDILGARMGAIPEIIQVMQLGPVEVFFTSHVLDCRVHVWRLQLRRRPLR